MNEITISLDDRHIDELAQMAEHLRTDLATVARALLAGAIEAQAAHEERRSADPINPRSESWDEFQDGVGSSPAIAGYAETV